MHFRHFLESNTKFRNKMIMFHVCYCAVFERFFFFMLTECLVHSCSVLLQGVPCNEVFNTRLLVNSLSGVLQIQCINVFQGEM